VIHSIVGTAGHVDHGKTALVKALTGVDCDTHKEEKRRGITINLGFAHLALPNGDIVGIVDVPGHRDFVHTMAAGAHGIDVVLMVIAADGGVRPQTEEHLRICEALGISRGIVALNKADLVDEAGLAAARARLATFTKGTFLDGCPVVAVSAITGRGIPELAAAIAAAVAASPRWAGSGVFRMYIDRIFSVSGFGTVVTGSVTGGTLRAGAAAWLLPGARELRVRRMERYGAETNEVVAGDRASLNLAGLSKEEFRRGMLVADRPLAETVLLDASVRLFPGVKPLPVWSQAEFIMGTFEAQARIHLMDANTLAPGGPGLAQIHLPSPCIAQAQDAFVLRSSSGDATVGGGTVIDPHPLHHRRRPENLVQQLRDLSSGKLPMLAAAEVAKHPAGVECSALAEALNVSPEDLDAIDKSGFPGGMVVLASEDKRFYVSPARFDELAGKVKQNLADYHAANPLLETGRTAEEIQGILGADEGDNGKVVCLLLLERLMHDGALGRSGRTFVLAGHSVNLTREEREQCRTVEDYILKCGMQAPVPAELEAHAKQAGIDGKRLAHLLKFIASSRVVYAVEGTFLHVSVVDKCRNVLCAELAKHPEGLTVAQFRDLVSGNRKICLMLYALFDAEGTTERRGDVRVLTNKGRERAASGQ
jgi:selenocysteine-specific elongation factor